MPIYINSNGKQSGPIEEAAVASGLTTGEFSPDDLGIRHGGTEWKCLGELFPNAVRSAPSPLVTSVPIEGKPAPKKSWKGLLLGCAGFFVVALLVGSVLGFFVYRNMFPPDSVEDLPDQVKDFKLQTRYPPKGNIWGTETLFSGLYYDQSKQMMIYMMTVYSDEETAKDKMRSELLASCSKGDTPLYAPFVKDGVEVSQGATCYAGFFVQKGNRVARFGGPGVSADSLIAFAENLPFNIGTKMTPKKDK